MRLARVEGQVVATRKDPRLQGVRLLLIQLIDETGRDCGRPQVAVDAMQSREGELVFVVLAREASLAVAGRLIPSDCSIVGQVDAVSE